MKILCFELKPQTEFSSIIKGDTLFAFFCCQLADLFGQERLDTLLTDYTNNKPFMVVSDFFLHGYLPRPTVPTNLFGFELTAQNRKQAKQKKWIRPENLCYPLNQLHQYLEEKPFQKRITRMHNAVNPSTGLVDSETYAPYTLKQVAFLDSIDVYIVYDEQRIELAEIEAVLKHIGLCGIGRGASRGIGKFEVVNKKIFEDSGRTSEYYMTLAPCVPQVEQVDADQSYYKLFTRFGKQFYFSGKPTLPYKKPVLTADTGAIFRMKNPEDKKAYFGCGLKNSITDEKVVFQGYAPIVPIVWKEER